MVTKERAKLLLKKCPNDTSLPRANSTFGVSPMIFLRRIRLQKNSLLLQPRPEITLFRNITRKQNSSNEKRTCSFRERQRVTLMLIDHYETVLKPLISLVFVFMHATPCALTSMIVKLQITSIKSLYTLIKLNWSTRKTDHTAHRWCLQDGSSCQTDNEHSTVTGTTTRTRATRQGLKTTTRNRLLGMRPSAILITIKSAMKVSVNFYT